MFKRKPRRSREWKKNNKLIDLDKARENRTKNRESLKAAKAGKPPKAEPSKRQTVKTGKRRDLYAALMLIVIAVIGFSVFNIISVNHQLAEAMAEKHALEMEKEKLEYELQNVDNREYVEQQARMLLKMIMPGEIYYVVPDRTEEGDGLGATE